MVKFNCEDDGKISIHCPFCGIDVGPEMTGQYEDCNHLVLHTTGEGLEPEYDRDGIYKNLSEEDDHLFSKLESLSDEYLQFSVSPSRFLEVIYLFKYQ